jgi:hypothetical protein
MIQTLAPAFPSRLIRLNLGSFGFVRIFDNIFKVKFKPACFVAGDEDMSIFLRMRADDDMLNELQ